MKYYLTDDQFYKLWDDSKIITPPYEKRIEYIMEKYNLYYEEEESRYDPGYWGVIEGDEKYINWFLLNL